MVWRSLPDIAFSDAKQLLVGCRQQPAKWNQKIVVILKSKKMFLFGKIDKNVQFNFLFLGNFHLRLRIGGGFFILVWKKLYIWSSVLFTVFALEMCKRKAYRKQTGPNVSVLLNKVSVLEHGRFIQVSQAVSWIFANT